MKQKTQLFITNKNYRTEDITCRTQKQVRGDNIWTVSRHYTKFPGAGQSCVFTKFDVKDFFEEIAVFQSSRVLINPALHYLQTRNHVILLYSFGENVIWKPLFVVDVFTPIW